ncbi:MAG: hypothetical protein ACREPE_09280 [Lysobacter sp.]
MKPIAHAAWIVCALLLGGVVWPTQTLAQGDRLSSDWVAMAPQKLDRMRGGLVLPSGLLLSFGIERVVYVNGQLISTTSVNVPDIARITTDQAQGLAGLQDTTLIQIGEGNTFVPNSAGGLVIQNTLNDQDIRALTTLNIGTSTLGLFQELNANAALQNALINAPGAP